MIMLISRYLRDVPRLTAVLLYAPRASEGGDILTIIVRPAHVLLLREERFDKPNELL